MPCTWGGGRGGVPCGEAGAVAAAWKGESEDAARYCLTQTPSNDARRTSADVAGGAAAGGSGAESRDAGRGRPAPAPLAKGVPGRELVSSDGRDEAR